ncbi:hypothetical Protein YC6258_02095 [Gynuella sunshinyii YC6258]|uniref:Uncharacterized protein n=1 Tax=Gynuella sunshinyii YC6258 TaxID=1445510 RepID=A0A0C5VHI7_9GAMM|nr:hypothetical Protein YC6258_02095 [Gynuella sunshinyii YC6258]
MARALLQVENVRICLIEQFRKSNNNSGINHSGFIYEF